MAESRCSFTRWISWPAIAIFGSVNGNGAEPEVKNSFENVAGDAVAMFPAFDAAKYVYGPVKVHHVTLA